MLKEITHLMASWNKLEERLEELLGEFNLLQQQMSGIEIEEQEKIEEIHRLKEKSQNLLHDKEELDLTSLQGKEKFTSDDLKEVDLNILSIVCRWMGALFTLAFDKVCQNGQLRNRIIILKTQNHYLEEKVTLLQEIVLAPNVKSMNMED